MGSTMYIDISYEIHNNNNENYEMKGCGRTESFSPSDELMKALIIIRTSLSSTYRALYYTIFQSH